MAAVGQVHATLLAEETLPGFVSAALYVLKYRRAILKKHTAVSLAHIERLQVWLTSLTIHAVGKKRQHVNRANRPSVARLIHETICIEGRA